MKISNPKLLVRKTCKDIEVEVTLHRLIKDKYLRQKYNFALVVKRGYFVLCSISFILVPASRFRG